MNSVKVTPDLQNLAPNIIIILIAVLIVIFILRYRKRNQK